MPESLFQDPMSVAGLLAVTVGLALSFTRLRVVAGVYHPALAPVGLLMAVAGYVLGIYGALATAWLLRQVGGA